MAVGAQFSNFLLLTSNVQNGRLAQWESASFTPKRSLVRIQYRPPCGSSSVVERQLPKLNVAGSNPVSRSITRRRSQVVKAAVCKIAITGSIPVVASIKMNAPFEGVRFYGGHKLAQVYSRPGRRERGCRDWWFDGWDWLANRALSLAGRPSVGICPGEIAFDPHIHTLFSHCSISQPERIILDAVRLGLGAVGIMDHNSIRGALDCVRCGQYLKSAGRIPQDFLVIPGVEVNSTIGHVGALFVECDLPMGLEPVEIVKAIHNAGGLAVAVHPYHSTGIGDAVFDAPFDAIEIECGSVFGSRLVKRNRELASDPRLSRAAKLGSSDAHYVRAMASCYTIARIKGTPTLAALKRAIASGNCQPMTSRPYDRLARLLGLIRKLH